MIWILCRLWQCKWNQLDPLGFIWIHADHMSRDMIAMWDILLCCHCLTLRELWVEYMESHSSVSQPVGQEDPPYIVKIVDLFWLHNNQMGEYVSHALCVHGVALCVLVRKWRQVHCYMDLNLKWQIYKLTTCWWCLVSL